MEKKKEEERDQALALPPKPLSLRANFLLFPGHAEKVLKLEISPHLVDFYEYLRPQMIVIS